MGPGAAPSRRCGVLPRARIPLYTHVPTTSRRIAVHSGRSPGQAALSLSTREVGPATVIAVAGEADLDNVGSLGAALDAAARTPEGPVVLDLAELTFADSTTINVVLRAYGVLGPRLRLAALTPFLERVLGVTGVSEVVPVFRTVAEALENDAV
ncbi:STAS domain-containing protein [Streptomyces sp. NPDC087843]|uniref:STAS domain-containing protein n=1 Tax=Streptomyces sp. NPDC087843 TaxID=3365804 RepID=UPI0038024AE1